MYINDCCRTQRFFAKNHLLFPVLLAPVLFAVFLTKFSVLSFVANKMFWICDVC